VDRERPPFGDFKQGIGRASALRASLAGQGPALQKQLDDGKDDQGGCGA